MPGEIPGPQPPELITHVPTAEELAAQAPNTQYDDEISHTLTRGALDAMLAGEQGSAAELNLKYPSPGPEKAPVRTAVAPFELPEPSVTPEEERTLYGDDLKQLREQLRQHE